MLYYALCYHSNFAPFGRFPAIYQSNLSENKAAIPLWLGGNLRSRMGAALHFGVEVKSNRKPSRGVCYAA